MKVLLDFYADWCQPCKAMKPIIEELEKDYTVLAIDVDKESEKAQLYGVMSIPTMIVMSDEKEIVRFQGVTEKSKLIKALEL